MTQVPPGAQRSDDGNYWWDGSQWQPVPGGAADPAAAGTSPQAAERAAQALPQSPQELSATQLPQYLSEPTVHVAVVDADQTEVPAMQETGSNGQAMA
jgi:hypothetical protein